jgi:hypothetical protein
MSVNHNNVVRGHGNVLHLATKKLDLEGHSCLSNPNNTEDTGKYH